MRFTTLDRAEVAVVIRAVNFSRRAGLQRVARTVTRLGNGPLYPIAAAALVLTRVAPPRFLVAASLSVLTSLAIHAKLKKLLRRARPCDYDRTVVRDLVPLDRYSCPSGHAMIAVAFAVPLVAASPSAMPLATSVCLLMGWSRLAVGHHYLSDVVIGAALGAAVAFPLTVALL